MTSGREGRTDTTGGIHERPSKWSRPTFCDVFWLFLRDIIRWGFKTLCTLLQINPPGEYTKQKLGKQIAAAITGSSSCVTIPRYCLWQDSVFVKKNQLACLHLDCQVNDGTMVDLKIRLSSLHLRMQLMCRIDLLDMSHTGKLSFRGHHVWSLTLFPSAFKFWLVLFFFFLRWRRF